MKHFVTLGWLVVAVSMVQGNPPTLGFDDKVQPAAAPASIAPPPAYQADAANVSPEAIRPRATVRFDLGDGVGYSDGFTYLETFLPLYEDVGRWLLFNNLRLVNFQNADLWEFNGGFGVRHFNPCNERIFGIHGHYDGRTTLTKNYFQQATVGWESLGPWIDFRNNFYIPTGTQSVQTGQSGFFDPRFVGHNILLSQNRQFETSLGGLDAEVGGLLPGIDAWAVRAYLGYYHYSGSGAQTINGARARIEANVNDSLTLHLAVQNDAVNDTQVTGGLAFHFGPGKMSRGIPGAAPYARMGERVVRDPNIVITQQQKTVQEVALDAKTGNPILVRHANSSAQTGGDGTIERPYRTLGDLQAGSIPRDILFVHANSVFTGQAITLQNNQRFLGEGLIYTFAAKQGTFLLPRATSGTLLPVIQNSPSNMVTLASDTETAGFHLLNAGRHAVYGKDIANVNLHDLTILDPARNGVRLSDVGGINNLTNSSITGARTGVSIRLNDATQGTYILTNNSFSGNTRDGLAVRLRDSSQATVVADNNQFLNNGQVGAWFETTNKSNLTVTLANSGIQKNPEAGVLFEQYNSSNVVANLNANSFVGNGSDHVGIFLENQSKGVYTLTKNTLDVGTQHGVHVGLYNSSQANVTLTENQITKTASTGVLMTTTQDAKLTTRLDGNVISGGDDIGLEFFQDRQSQIIAQISNNQFRSNKAGQILIGLDNKAVGEYALTKNILNGTIGTGMLAILRSNSKATINLQENEVTRSLLGGVRFDLADKANFTVDLIKNTFSKNLITGVSFSQVENSTVTAHILGNTFIDNSVAHLLINLEDKSQGAYQIYKNTANGGLGTSLFASASDNATLCMQLIENTSNRSVILRELGKKSNFVLEDTLDTNELTGSAMFFRSTSILPLALYGTCGFDDPKTLLP